MLIITINNLLCAVILLLNFRDEISKPTPSFLVQYSLIIIIINHLSVDSHVVLPCS